MKRIMIILCSLAWGVQATAQDTQSGQQSVLADPFSNPMLPYYVVFAALAVSIILILTVAVYVYRVLNLMTEQARKVKAEKQGIPYIPLPSLWQRFSQKVNASVPVEQEKEIELDHSYDGIKELDNHLPPWWKWLFYGTIGWSVVYLFVFHLSGSLPLSEEEYQIELAEAEERSRTLNANQPSASIDENALQYTADAALIEKGKNVFNSNPCGSCHRNDGGGNTIGPNLTDEYWIHGGDIKSIFNTIKNGAVDKGMPAWGKAMSLQDVRDVTFYVLSLQGTNPPDGKAPQGDVYKQATSIKSDTTRSQASL